MLCVACFGVDAGEPGLAGSVYEFVTSGADCVITRRTARRDVVAPTASALGEALLDPAAAAGCAAVDWDAATAGTRGAT